MDDQPRYGRLHVEHLGPSTPDGDQPRVGLLSTAFGVERSRVEHELDGLALARNGHDAGWCDERAHPRFASHLGVSGEVHRPAVVERGAVGRQVGVAALASRRVGLGPRALLGHEPAEAVGVDVEPLLGRDLEGQIDRKAIRVM